MVSLLLAPSTTFLFKSDVSKARWQTAKISLLNAKKMYVSVCVCEEGCMCEEQMWMQLVYSRKYMYMRMIMIMADINCYHHFLSLES